MAKTKCAYGKRGKSSIEWYKYDGTPQRYCYGWIDDYTDEIPEECRKCPDHVFNAQKDLEEYNAWILAGDIGGSKYAKSDRR